MWSASTRPKRSSSSPRPSATPCALLVADLLDGGACVIMTLRSDFLDRSTGMPHIGAEIGRGVYAIGPLSVDGLREAVERPAERAGLRLEPGLVEVIVRDAGDRRTTLPHVSHALVETWIRREGATLTVAGYEASGGIAGAIAQSAETLYRSFDDADADSCRSLMLRLVHRGADGASVRRSACAGSPGCRRVAAQSPRSSRGVPPAHDRRRSGDSRSRGGRDGVAASRPLAGRGCRGCASRIHGRNGHRTLERLGSSARGPAARCPPSGSAGLARRIPSLTSPSRRAISSTRPPSGNETRYANSPNALLATSGTTVGCVGRSRVQVCCSSRRSSAAGSPRSGAERRSCRQRARAWRRSSRHRSPCSRTIVRPRH